MELFLAISGLRVAGVLASAVPEASAGVGYWDAPISCPTGVGVLLFLVLRQVIEELTEVQVS